MTEMKESREERDDRLLSAYLDGELPETQADEITARLAREPELARRLEALQSVDPATRALFDRLDDLPMPRGVVDLLNEDSQNSRGRKPSPGGNNVLAFPRRLVRGFGQVPVAIAAALALVAGFLGGRLQPGSPGPALDALYAQHIPAASGVHDLLENGISTEPARLADGSEARLLLTFEDRAGNWCRQLAVSREGRQLQALACRRDGRWQTEALAFGQPASGEFRQAGGDTPAAIDAAIDRLIAGEPADAEAERALVRDAWKKN